MLPTPQTTDTQKHVQHPQLPSHIRTRSQNQHPLSAIDLSASPLKKAIRNHNLNHKSFLSHPAKLNERAENVDHNPPDDDADDELLLSPSHKKRASSPSFATSRHSEKRIRVLGESIRTNSVGRRHSEESLGTPSKKSATPLSLKRAVSSGSPMKGIVHLDLTKVPSSPSKAQDSPSKTFHITVDGGRRMNVPVTPGRKTSNTESRMGPRTPGASPRVPSLAEFKVHIDVPNSPSESKRPSGSTQQQSTSSERNEPRGSLLNSTTHGCDNNAPNTQPSTNFQFQSTPIRPRHLGDELLFGGSPLTPLPPTPHPTGSVLPRRSLFPQSTSNQGHRLAPSPLFPSTPAESLKVGQTSPGKSRIPIPTSSSVSRIPRPSSSFSLAGVVTSRPSSPAKSPPRRPLKSKPKINRKPKSEVRSRAPITRLAAKRGIKRVSFGIGLGAGPSSSTGPNLAPPSSENAGPSTSYNSFGIDGRKLTVTSGISAKNAAAPTGPSLLSQSNSPSKPTPLSALSTALQKLLVHPPAAPAHRPRPNTSLGFSGPGHSNAKTPGSTHTGTNADVVVRTPGKAPQANVGIQRPQSSLGHSRPSGTPNGLGKLGLPVRRLGPPMGPGGSAQKTGAPFASKQTTLSTVPASPARSAVTVSGNDAPSIPRSSQNEILDVDAWVPNRPSDQGKGKEKEETGDIEFTVPLADGSPTKRQVPAGLVSPSRRASQASLSLTKSLSLPRAPPAVHPTLVRSASTSTAVPYNPRTPVKTRGRTKPPPPAPEAGASTKPSGPMGGKRSNARMPGSLDVLKDCVIFVDVRTEEGEDAGALFIDMLRGLGARILAKPGKSCTHLVYKDGSPMTITKYKLLPEPRPLPVSIGWVVECVEKREHVEETRFLVNFDEIGVAGGAQRRRSMQPKQMRVMTLGQLDNGQPADISVRADSSFTSEEPSASGLILAGLSPPVRSPNDNLPPLERARQRSLQMSRR